jgi:hypothetical protein
MFQETELQHQNGEDHFLRTTSFGETVDKVEVLRQFFESERNEIEVENLQKILYKMTKDVEGKKT